ncbi:MAG TPA: hypothetical protein VK772_08315 [Puia sp.]|jgi:hypothetical protein|nr:hypothetical protein [Puia sp.]
MMKVLLTVVFPVLYSVGMCQSPGKVTIIKDTTVRVPSREYPHYADEKSLAVILSNGIILSDTSKVTIGKGSLPNGDFQYIARFTTISSQVYEVRLKGSTKSLMMEVQNITKRVDGNNVPQYEIVCIGGYQIQLANALLTGEIIL